MYVILTYDVSAKRNSRVLKICRKYLIHVQKSVFEGSISEASLRQLQNELQKVINPSEDQIAIYEINSAKYSVKHVIGYHLTFDNIL